MNLCIGGLDCEGLFVAGSVLADSLVVAWVGNRPFCKRNKSIKFGIKEKFDGSGNAPGICDGGGIDEAPMTSKFTDGGLFE